MEILDNSATWFEIPVKDFDRAKAFYSTIYDYEMPEMEMETGSGTNRMGFLLFEQEPHRVGGAIVEGEGYVPSKEGTLVYLNGGSDLQTVLDRIEPAGGTVLMPKTHIREDIGYMALFEDTEGNRLALHSRQ